MAYAMQATLAAWLMATLTPSVFMVALVQTSSNGPFIVFGLFAGAIADIIERRKIILVTQVLMFSVTLLLGIATVAGLVGPVSLLFATFVLGCGYTFYQPAQLASVNELVGRAELPHAMSLNSIANNMARALGPASAGLLAALLGTGSALIASAMFFLMMIVGLRWTPKQVMLPGVPEKLLSGVASGMRYVWHSPALRVLVIKIVGFGFCAAAFWALLPVIARDQLSLDASGYGLLSGGFGLGAVVGALTLPFHLSRKQLNTVVNCGAVLWCVATFLIAVSHHVAFALIGAFGAGMAWVSTFASMATAIQSSAPAWVRARAVATHFVAVFTSLAVGSIVWGAVASAADIRMAMAIAAILLLLLTAAARGMVLRLGEEANVLPGAPAPDHVFAVEPRPGDGPVLIQVEYRIAPADRDAFLQAANAMDPIRRRNGASSWRVFRDLFEDDRVVEQFIIASWIEYVRLRTRLTINDRQLQARVEAFQRPGIDIRVTRLIGIEKR